MSERDGREETFVATAEHRRFVEFCDACRRHRYIGLCHGPPGVGKTLSARRHAHWDEVMAFRRDRVADGVALNDALGDMVFYSVPVVNSAKGVLEEIARLRERRRDLVRADIERQKEIRIAEVRKEELEIEQEAIAAIVRITGGNFRLLDRLLTQIGRILQINALDTVTREAVEAAREVLVIGAA